MSTVKLKKEKQKQIKAISKAIYIISKISKICVMIGVVVLAMLLVIIPTILYNTKINDDTIEIFGENYNYEINDNQFIFDGNSIQIESSINMQDYLINHSTLYHALVFECLDICLIIFWVLTTLILNYIEKLFNNIHNLNTPFTLENIKCIKRIFILLLIAMIFSAISSIIFELIIKINVGIEFRSIDLILILIIASISYIFEYGYELQLDSQGVMYEE